MSRIALNKMYGNLSKHHKVSPQPSHWLHHHFWWEIQDVRVVSVLLSPHLNETIAVTLYLTHLKETQKNKEETKEKNQKENRKKTKKKPKKETNSNTTRMLKRVVYPLVYQNWVCIIIIACISRQRGKWPTVAFIKNSSQCTHLYIIGQMGKHIL